jgi:hypothetical protein
MTRALHGRTAQGGDAIDHSAANEINVFPALALAVWRYC